ncbi:YfiR family protein [Azospirillum sp. SYSU D00513]|uniref:YfiR/HmsC family protein n=1 Tax=Azospirillum sp. SYSU D00513 TaxID=2812561 RepID=UPI001A976515
MGTALLSAPPAGAAQDTALEDAVKATYLYKLPPFIEWPPSAHAGPSSPFNLCILGNDPFGGALDRAVAGQSVGGHGIAVLRLRGADAGRGCHVLYLHEVAAPAAAEALAQLRGRPVLTVTDAATEPRAKGMINFVLREGRVRFEIDDRAAAESGLSISSKLLSLAVSVRHRG